jgi:oxygen-independent coproporphyrinogen III oxidase
MNILNLLEKYNVPGPRYTSYPTVPIWTESVQSSDYKQSLNAVKGDEPLSLYFHLPFCERLCHFCGCMQVITKDHSRSKPYIDILLSEMDAVFAELKNSNRTISQIHLGGGTPNFIQPDELSQIMQKIRDHCHVLPDAEIAVEMHPRTSTEAFSDRLKKEGFNRISLGVQDFDEDVQKLIHRFQTYDNTKSMVEYLRGLGFQHFNFDIVYGLPGQSLEKFPDTLEKTLTLKPNRLAVYSYAHVPWIRPVQRAFKDSDIPSAHTKLELFEMALNFFTKHDYHLIGMDHFADKQDELYTALQNKSIHRNFMGYTTRADAHQIGFGVSSISYVNGNYFQNFKKLPEYEQSIKSESLATYRGFILNQDDKIRRDLITELMCQQEIKIPEFEEAHSIQFSQLFANELELLKGFVDDSLLQISPDKIQVTGNGHLVLRNMAMCFDEHLDAIKKNATNPVFSKTV